MPQLCGLAGYHGFSERSSLEYAFDGAAADRGSLPRELVNERSRNEVLAPSRIDAA